MTMITRTIVKNTHITFRTIVNGEVSEAQTMTFEGMVGNPTAVLKKALKLKKTDSIIIDNFNEDSALYGCTVEEFMNVAHIIEK